MKHLRIADIDSLATGRESDAIGLQESVLNQMYNTGGGREAICCRF